MLEEESVASKLYYYAKCSKCREGLCLLEENGTSVELVEYTKTSISEHELTELIQMLGIKPFDLVRTKEELFKAKFSKRSKTRFNWIAAMIKHPELMERPIFVHNNKAVIGRPPTKILEII